MATTTFNVVEKSVFHFLHLWDLGLQPTLSIITNSDGSLAINSSVTSFSPSLLHSRRFSGSNARHRRRRKRSHLQPSSLNAIANSNHASSLNAADVTTDHGVISVSRDVVEPDRCEKIIEALVPALQEIIPQVPKPTFQTQSTQTSSTKYESKCTNTILNLTSSQTQTGVDHTSTISSIATPTMLPNLSTTTQMMMQTPSHGSSRCELCKKVFETIDDRRWHFNTQYGQQDCRILQSMLT